MQASGSSPLTWKIGTSIIFAMSVAYVKRALDRAGVEPEVFAKGRFKSAGEQLVRESIGLKDDRGDQLNVMNQTFRGNGPIGPMESPPMMLMKRMRMPATASPRTNLLAPSIEP